MSNLQDKNAVLHVLGSLINDPTLLSNSRGYSISHEDFPERMHKIIFSAISNLYNQGLEKITTTDIYSYISTFPEQLTTFEANEGVEYIQSCASIGTEDNFEYFFNRVRKFSYLRECAAVGIDVRDIYDDSTFEVHDVESMEIKFNSMTLEDIIKHINLKLISVNEKYTLTSENTSRHMGSDIDAILENKLTTSSYGKNWQSHFSNTITRGCKTSKVYLTSAPTGVGKTMYNLADLLEITVPEKWDIANKCWIKTGSEESGLFITTEIPEEDIQTATMCHVAGVDRGDLEDGKVTQEEIERLKKATEILQRTNLYIERLEDFDLEQVELAIEKNIIKHDIRYVVFDYIHTSLRLLTQIGQQAKGLREDLILLILSSKLKDMATKYDIAILTSTQMNDNWKDDGHMNLDQSSIRGSKAIADKVDVGKILLRVSKADLKAFEELYLPALQDKKEYRGINNSVPTPTHTMNYYKNRETRWINVRVWLSIDMGTLRTTDVFVTEYNGDMVEKIYKTNIDSELIEKVEAAHEKKAAKRLEEAKEIKEVVTEEALEIVSTPRRKSDNKSVLDNVFGN